MRVTRRSFSRYHVARFMELHYGAGVPFRRLAVVTGCDKGAICRAIKRAEQGQPFPPVTPRFVSFARLEKLANKYGGREQ